MAAGKKLKDEAEALGLDSEGSAEDVKARIAAAKAEDAAAAPESSPEPVIVAAEPSPESVRVPVESGPMPELIGGPEPQVITRSTQKVAHLDNTELKLYDILSSFWIPNMKESALAQAGMQLKMTERQAFRFTRRNALRLVA